MQQALQVSEGMMAMAYHTGARLKQRGQTQEYSHRTLRECEYRELASLTPRKQIAPTTDEVKRNSSKYAPLVLGGPAADRQPPRH
jgi:hypothetical protein